MVGSLVGWEGLGGEGYTGLVGVVDFLEVGRDVVGGCHGEDGGRGGEGGGEADHFGWVGFERKVV